MHENMGVAYRTYDVAVHRLIWLCLCVQEYDPCHWLYLIGAFVMLVVAYLMFKNMYYCSHKIYLV